MKTTKKEKIKQTKQYREREMKIENTHYGQKQKYGDSFYEYTITSEENVTRDDIDSLIKNKKLYKYDCLLSKPSRDECMNDFGMNFTTYVNKIQKISEKEWFVQIISPSTH